MHCTDFFQIGESIRRAEQAELRRALEAHGGLFRFEDVDEQEVPVITFNLSDDSGPTDVEIRQASINDNGQLCLTGVAVGDIVEIEYPADEVMPTHTHFITMAIPPAKGVEDVTDTASPFFLLAAETIDGIG